MGAKIHCFSRVQPTGKKRTRCYNVAMKTGWVFLLDALLDGVMVTLALRLGGAKASVWRIVLAALLGAAAARLCAGLPREGRALLWLPIAMGMMAAACGRAIRPFRAAGLLLGAAGLLGGTIQALSGATGSKATGLLLGTLAIPLLSAAMIRASRMRRDVQTVRVRMTFFDDAPVVPCPVSTPTAEYQTVTFVSDDGATLSARYIRPVGNKRVPTVLMFHDAGRPVRGWHHMTRFVALGYAVFALENRAEADAQTQFADAQAAARAALSLPTTLNLIAWGEGLGGTLAIAAAAKQPQHVVKCAAQNPLCTGVYADCAQYAAQLVCPLLMGTSGMDTIAPPDAQNAVYDAASCDKKRYIYVKYIHERINAFEDRVLAFFHPMV